MLSCKSVILHVLTPDFAEKPAGRERFAPFRKTQTTTPIKRPERGGPVALWKLQNLRNQLRIEVFRDFEKSKIATKIAEHHPPATRARKRSEGKRDAGG